MHAEFLRGALRLALLILVLAVVMLPFQPRGSGEFVVTVMAAVIGALFVLAIVLVARWYSPSIPDADDKRSRKALNGRPPTQREGKDTL